MKAVIASALDRSDVVILSGGLGPTEDDLTKEVCAEVMGLPLSEDPHSRKRIERYMKEYKKNHPDRRPPIIISRRRFRKALLCLITTTVQRLV